MTDAVLRGTLRSIPIAAILTFLQSLQKNGTLILTNVRKETGVVFRDGAVVYATSNQEQFRLGAVLLRKQMLSSEQGEAIDALMRSNGGRFGEVAVRQGFLTDDQVRDFLKVQVSEILYDAFVWDGGDFSFTEEMRLPDHAVTIALDLPNLLLEGARRIDQWEQCTRLLPDKTVIFRAVAKPAEEKVTLTADEWKILFLINGRRTLEELCQESNEDPFHVYRVVYGLQASKLIEPIPFGRRRTFDDSRAAASVAVNDTDDTYRQYPRTSAIDGTIRETPDDAGLLISGDARLLYSDVVRSTVAQLVIRNEAAPQTVSLSDPQYTIGRHRENSIRLDDPGVSSFHARIYRGPDGYVIEDLKSRNGVWINGKKTGEGGLRDGDRLQLGQTELTYSVLYQPAK